MVIGGEFLSNRQSVLPIAVIFQVKLRYLFRVPPHELTALLNEAQRTYASLTPTSKWREPIGFLVEGLLTATAQQSQLYGASLQPREQRAAQQP